MRSDLKMARQLAKLAELTQSLGGTAPQVTDKKALVEIVREEKRKPVAHIEAEAVLRVLHKPASFVFKNCKKCSLPFGADYHGVAYCSDACRIKSLADQGIQWNPTKRPEERWGSEQDLRQPPMVIPPAAVKALIRLLSTLHGVYLPDPDLIPDGPVGQKPESTSDENFPQPAPSDDPLQMSHSEQPQKLNPAINFGEDFDDLFG